METTPEGWNPQKMMPVLGNDLNQCMMCGHLVEIGVHFNSSGKGWRCAAFGDQDIPDAIVTGRHDHRKPWPPPGRKGLHDRGILFQDSVDASYTYEDLAGPVTDD